MGKNYQIVNTEITDLEFVCHLFDEAIFYQKNKGYPVWNGYDRDVLKTDIENHLQFKIMEDHEIACIFSICYEDSIIWREKEQGDAIYLHRIVVNPKFKGQKQFDKIMDWAIKTAKDKRLNSIRMDTWGDNQNIIDYYQSFGFSFVENYTTPNTDQLAVQHRNLYLALLEYGIEETGVNK